MLFRNPFLAAHPVNSIFISISSTNPGTLFGGTWSVFGAGRMLISLSADTDFDTAEETGGSKTSTGLIAHTHLVVKSGTGTSGLSSSNAVGAVRGNAGEYNYGMDNGAIAGNGDIGLSSSAGSGSSFSIMPPFIAVYMWKRTA